MKALVIKNLYKSFPIDKEHSFYALNNINLSFDEYGFVSIVGKSGSGKSTLLNMISKFDKPSRGEIYLNKKKYVYKNKKDYLFYRDQIGIVSQQYNLIPDTTVMDNVTLPLLFSGCRKNKAISKATSLLEYVGIPIELYNAKVNKLSGGEAQRVAIARALIRNPKILLCDEPTGALDSANSIKVMELLSSISKSRLVIMVSHNLQIVKEYCNRIIEIADGSIIHDYLNKKFESELYKEHKISKGRINWTSRFSKNNYKKRIKRNLFVVASLSISMIITNLVFGFINGKDTAIKNASYNQLDFGYGYISKDELVTDTGFIKLTKSVRPNINELRSNEKIAKIFNICPNFSAILPQNPKILIGDTPFDKLSYTPIYSYVDDSINKSLLFKGSLPKSDNLSEVVVNLNCYNQIHTSLGYDPIGEYINIYHKFESIYVNEYKEEITDYFEYSFSCKIVGVVNELEYLNTPKIYYSYLGLESYLQEYVLLNLSTYYDNKITWYDRVMDAEDYSIISSYSYQLFLKNYRDRDLLFDDSIFSDYSFNSSSLVIANSLIGFANAAEYALFLFLAIGIVGTLLILTIISFTNYSEDRKVSAILSSLGARDSDIENIYINENLYSGFISLILSLALSYPLSLLINHIVYKYINVSQIIDIPYLSFLNIPLLYPLAILVMIIFLITIATVLPIKFSKRRNLSLELKVND